MRGAECLISAQEIPTALGDIKGAVVREVIDRAVVGPAALICKMREYLRAQSAIGFKRERNFGSIEACCLLGQQCRGRRRIDTRGKALGLQHAPVAQVRMAGAVRADFSITNLDPHQAARVRINVRLGSIHGLH